jgi:hypothetical protein
MAATNLMDAIDITRDNIYKGSARVVISDPDTLTSFPGRIESVMNPGTPADGGTAYELVEGWSDLGPTSEDGVTVSREAELSDGIALDQMRSNLDEGEPESWAMNAAMTLMETTLETINKVWEAGSIRTQTASGTNVAQRSLTLDAPTSFTERMMAVIQEDPKTSKLRMFVFRKVKPRVEGGEMAFSRNEASGLEGNFTLEADEDIDAGYGQFGKIFEEGTGS